MGSKFFKYVLGKLVDIKEGPEMVEIIKDNIVPPAFIDSNPDYSIFRIRSCGMFKGLGSHLPKRYYWLIIEDEMGEAVLVKQEKEEE